MAPPRNRRPGFSRRIQFGLFIGYVAAIVGAVLALGVALVSRLDPQGFGLLRSAAIDTSAPVSEAGRGVVRGVRAIGDGISGYFFAASRNEALEAELKVARRKLIEARTIALENQRLRQVLHLRDIDPQMVITARLVGSTASSTRRLATMAAGSHQGIVRGQPVRGVDGLIGRVFETGAFASRVLLLTDGESTVPVKLLRNGTPALVRGQGDGTLTVHALLPGGSPFRRNDVVVTSGTGGIYPPNIPVAIITRPVGDKADAWPLANPAAIDFAIVLKPYEPPLPPAPAPAP